MQRITKFVGLDVDQDTIAVGVADARGGAARSLGTIANSTPATLDHELRASAREARP